MSVYGVRVKSNKYGSDEEIHPWHTKDRNTEKEEKPVSVLKIFILRVVER